MCELISEKLEVSWMSEIEGAGINAYIVFGLIKTLS